MNIIKKLRKIPKAIRIAYNYFNDDKNAFLHLIAEEAKICLAHYNKLGVSYSEEIEDLLFHIESYTEVPNMVRETLYPHLDTEKMWDSKNKSKFSDEDWEDFMDYLTEVELQRAVERDFIFDLVKDLPFGFFI